MDYVLYHHGIKGMKWGIRRTPAQLGHKERPKTYKKAHKSTSSMTDEELKEAISRLELEKRYNDLLKNSYSVNDNKRKSLISHGKDFVFEVLRDSGKDIAKQYAKYMIGTAVNHIYGENIVNPKKGQKDK